MTSPNDQFLGLLASGNTLEALTSLEDPTALESTRATLNRTMYGPAGEAASETVRDAENAHLERLSGQDGAERAHTLYNLGCLSLMQDDILAARMRFAEAVKLDPGNIMARHNLAYAHELLAEFQEARQEYQAILDTNPNLGLTRLNLAQVLIQEGDSNGGIQALETLYDSDSGNAGLLLYLVRALLQRRSPDDVEHALALLDAEPASRSHRALQECRGFALLLREDYDTARPIFQSLHDTDPENLFARMGLIKIYAAEGEFEQLTPALEAYQSRDPMEKIDPILSELHSGEGPSEA